MGTVLFQTRRDSKVLMEDVLYDQNNDEFLISFLIGESVILTRDISKSQFDQLSKEHFPGVRVQKKVPTPANEEPGFMVDLEFIVVKRINHLAADWINKLGGFRSSGTTICLQSVSNEAELVFTELIKGVKSPSAIKTEGDHNQ